MSDDPIARAQKELHERAERNIDRGTALSADLDKALVSISGGALVFSMTFVGVLAPGKLLLPVLFLSWAAFGTSIACVIFSMRAAHNAIVAAVKKTQIDVERLKNDTALPVLAQMGIPPKVTPTVTHSKPVFLWNNCALSAFIIGLISLSFLIGYNLVYSPTQRITVPSDTTAQQS
jgi:hypothetical protein